MTIAIAIIIAAIGIGYTMSRMSKIRKEMPELAETAKKPPRVSKRQKRLEQIRAAEPEYIPPSIDDLVAEEIAEIGIDRIPGAEGLAPAVLLRVFRRDTPDTDRCLPERRRFVVANDISPSEVDIEDVRLVCEDHPPIVPERGLDADHEEERDADHGEERDADHGEERDADHEEERDADHGEERDADHEEERDADHEEERDRSED